MEGLMATLFSEKFLISNKCMYTGSSHNAIFDPEKKVALTEFRIN